MLIGIAKYLRGNKSYALVTAWLSRLGDHDTTDVDEDGLLGFVEIEYRKRAPGLALDPTDASSIGEVPDGEQDCDGGSVSNADELIADTDHLDPNDWCLMDQCRVCDQDPNNDCVEDCAGVLGGNATEDQCGVCDHNPTMDERAGNLRASRRILTMF